MNLIGRICPVLLCLTLCSSLMAQQPPATPPATARQLQPRPTPGSSPRLLLLTPPVQTQARLFRQEPENIERMFSIGLIRLGSQQREDRAARRKPGCSASSSRSDPSGQTLSGLWLDGHGSDEGIVTSGILLHHAQRKREHHCPYRSGLVWWQPSRRVNPWRRATACAISSCPITF